jgi:dienelactone hydrolase
MEQTFADRARESLAALAVLRAHPACSGMPVGLLGFCQGGWVSLLAATLGEVDFVVSLSGPGTTPAAQERDRIERTLQSRGASAEAIEDAMDWIDERTRRLLAGEPAADVLADQLRLADRSWYAGATEYFDSLPALSFLGRVLDFDPVPVLQRVPCPVLALFGASDTLVPVMPSIAAFAANLPSLPGDPHGLAVFPGADHGLFTADPDPAVPRTEQLAPGFLPLVAGFLSRTAEREPA